MTRGFGLALAMLSALTAASVLFGRNPHPHVWWEAVPAYGAFFGYAGAWALVLLAKSVLAPLLHRPDEEGEK